MIIFSVVRWYLYSKLPIFKLLYCIIRNTCCSCAYLPWMKQEPERGWGGGWGGRGGNRMALLHNLGVGNVQNGTIGQPLALLTLLTPIFHLYLQSSCISSSPLSLLPFPPSFCLFPFLFPLSFVIFPYYSVVIFSFFTFKFSCFYLVCNSIPTRSTPCFLSSLQFLFFQLFRLVILITSVSDPDLEPVGSASLWRIRTPGLLIRIRIRERIRPFFNIKMCKTVATLLFKVDSVQIIVDYMHICWEEL